MRGPRDLLASTASLVNIASVSHGEAEIADLIEAELRRYRHLEVVRVEDNVVARTARSCPQRLLLAGHLDTVPARADQVAVIDGDRCHGLGSADMKGGLAVMLALASRGDDLAVDTSFVFYACEEVARRDSGLLALNDHVPELLQANAAIILEPTDGAVEAGCQGVLRMLVTVKGQRAHSSRPWTGINAIHRLKEVLQRIEQFPERRPILEGCEFHETLQAVGVEGGGASNVVPDEARMLLSYRFAPDRDIQQAEEVLTSFFHDVLREELEDGAVIEEVAPSAAPSLDNEFLGALVDASARPARAKISWTDVAFFFERGVPAANFGPGDPLLAHSGEEFVTRSSLENAFDVLHQVLTRSAI